MGASEEGTSTRTRSLRSGVEGVRTLLQCGPLHHCHSEPGEGNTDLCKYSVM